MSIPQYPCYKTTAVEWLGDVPEHWTVLRFQRCVDVTEGQVDPEDPAHAQLPLIAPNHVESGTGRLLALESADEQAAISGKYLCRAGDVIYSKIRPGLRKVCVAPEACLCSADMYPLRGRSGLTNPFLFWLMLSEHFSAFAILESQRVAMPKINRESLKAVVLAVPPCMEQKHIADFLDRETARLDALVVEQRRLIKLLAEKRQAVISHAVTKGLNPDVPLRPSGIEALGDVPAHWTVMPLKRDMQFITSGSRGWADNYSEDGELFIRIANLTRDGIHLALSDIQRVSVPDGVEGSRTRVRADDLLFSITAYLGSVAVVPENLGAAYVSQHIALVRLRQASVLPQWIAFSALSVAGKSWFDQQSYGGTKIQLSLDDIRDFPVLAPPIAEQNQIVQFLQEKVGKLDTLATDAERAISLLQERRTALISAAVTGQFDVRSLVEAQPA